MALIGSSWLITCDISQEHRQLTHPAHQDYPFQPKLHQLPSYMIKISEFIKRNITRIMSSKPPLASGWAMTQTSKRKSGNRMLT